MGAAAQRILAHDAIAKMQIDMRPGAKRGQGSAVRRGTWDINGGIYMR
jgi:hypothetical protein